MSTAISEEDIAAFERNLLVALEKEHEPTPRTVDGAEIVWASLPGSQSTFLQCPIFECLLHGTRGPGKTTALLMDFAQEVGKGYGAAWTGVIFRETYPQLADVVAKSMTWFRRIFPGAKFNRSTSGAHGMQWVFETGERLLFRHIAHPDDYWDYHGHEYPWIGWEELTNWSTDQCYKMMFACCRSTNRRVPRKVRATTNPYGIGHNWVANRFRLNGQWWKTVVVLDGTDPNGNPEPPRCAIHSHVDENSVLLEADPNYKATIVAAATNQAMADAWRDGSWDLIAGGMFDDVWDRRVNVVPDFAIPPTFRITRAFDWGSSAPFSVGWYAISDGSDLLLSDGTVMSTVRGDVFRVREWYGWTGRANEGKRLLATEVAAGIVEREIQWGWRTPRGTIVTPGPADSAIFATENGVTISLDMAKPVRIGSRVYHGVVWVPSDKRPGSRKMGWEMARKLIKQARGKPGLPREKPGFFLVGTQNPQFLRTVLTLPRDEKDLDDVNTDAEDHIGDEFRYLVRSLGTEARTGSTVGTAN